jgi:peptidoglycan/xylan/chitin deacetylase (PgdA/CDA1 family)
MGLVVCYHGVVNSLGNTDPAQTGEVSVSTFVKHLEFFKRFFKFVPLHENHISRNNLSITFDDGYANNIQAAEILANLQIPACFFISTYFAQSESYYYWDSLRELSNGSPKRSPHKKLSELPRNLSFPRAIREISFWPPESRTALTSSLNEMATLEFNSSQSQRLRPMNPLEISQISSWPGMEIGLHSHTHGSFGSDSRNKNLNFFTEEHSISKSLLNSWASGRVNSFAYPFGTRDDIPENIKRPHEMIPEKAWSTQAKFNNDFVLDQERPRLVVREQPLSDLFNKIVKCGFRTIFNGNN